MRIQGGDLRGRSFTRPDSKSVRPISGRALEALFNLLGNVKGRRLLDAYAGSGAIGFEAASRGAVGVEAIERSPAVAKVIRQNQNKLGLTQGYRLHQMSVEQWQQHRDQTKHYDLIVADPPFAELDAKALGGFVSALAPAGIMAISHSSRMKPPELKSTVLTLSRMYGDACLSFYRPVENDASRSGGTGRRASLRS